MKLSIKEICYFLFVRLPNIIIGKYIKKNLVYVHWGRGLNNFGDCLQPDILRHYGLTPVYVPDSRRADIILAGSILQWLSPEYDGYIVGTGGDKMIYSFPNAKVLAVRGKLTLNNFKHNNGCDIKLGDPGLLMPFVYPKKLTYKYKLGIIPHFVDTNEKFIRMWKNNWQKENIIFINVLQAPHKVIEQIKQCQCIISSSLHGLIIADAYNLPNVRIVNRNTMPSVFYDYKFDDYYSALNCESIYVEVSGNETIDEMINYTTLKPIERVKKIQCDLNEIMLDFARLFKRN